MSLQRGLLAILITGVAAGGLGWLWLQGRSASNETTSVSTERPTPPRSLLRESDIDHFCGDCHRTPDPAAFPRRAWEREVQRGFEFYRLSQRTDLKVPPVDDVVAWFAERAPEEVAFPAFPVTAASSSIRFQPQSGDPVGGHSAIAHVRWDPRRKDFTVCNMWSGVISRVNPSDLTAHPLAGLFNPAHAEPVDLDLDGLEDLVVADLGSYLPADHSRGAVVWLRATGHGFEPKPLQTGLGRVADVRPGDFDGDGDTDLVVAEFGWRSTGRILLLRNTGTIASPQFSMETVDTRHGAIHVLPVDLNKDDRLDFIALISQEHESIVAFLNDGSGRFDPQPVFQAPDPGFGSTGIELVDFDRDGDLDVLYTAGDTFDSPFVKPYHGIRWLENDGRFPFANHELAAMPGVHRALAADLDGDGDLDVAACAMLEETLQTPTPAEGYVSLLWLEQVAPDRFVQHRLDGTPCLSAAMDLGDFDGDGDIDLAVGGFSTRDAVAPLTIWWNRPAHETGTGTSHSPRDAGREPRSIEKTGLGGNALR